MRWIEQFRMSMLMLFRRESQSKRLNDELAVSPRAAGEGKHRQRHRP